MNKMNKSVTKNQYHVNPHSKSERSYCYNHLSFDRWFSYAVFDFITFLSFHQTYYMSCKQAWNIIYSDKLSHESWRIIAF